MTPILLTPWRGGDRHREMNRVAVEQHYAKSGMRHLFVDSSTIRFSRTAARNEAARRTTWDVAAFIDADCIVPIETLEAAMDQAFRTGKVILPHDRFWPLNEAGTLRALAEPNIAKWDPEWTGDPIIRKRPSGVIVVPWMAWAAFGGYDERLSGWGFEDTAFLWTAEDLGSGWERMPGPLWHLWHPSASGTWLPEDKALFERYKAAHGDYLAMLALLHERQGAMIAP